MEWAFWADLLIRSAMVIAAGELLRRVSRGSDPVHRHKILLLVFGLLLVLPLFSILLPSIHVPLWPPSAVRAIVTVQSTSYAVRGGAEIATGARIVNWLVLVWIFGVVAALGSLVAGAAVLLRMSRRAIPICDREWTDLVGELSSTVGLSKQPEVTALPGLAMPLALGIRRPRILLPGDCAAWTELRRRVVLLHELAHIQRRDLAAQLFANVVAAFWWFQPFIWVERRALRRESEQACDAQAIAAGIRPSDYAAELVEIARASRGGALWSRAAIAMARPGELEGRLLGVLNPQAARFARGGWFASIALLTAVAITASAVTLSSQQEFHNSGGLPMKRTLISGLLTSIGLSAATITGSVFDPSGAAMPDAKVLLYNPDTSVKQESASASNGKFAFDSLPAGQYILRVEKPGFAVLLREFTLQADSNVERGFGMQLAPTQKDVSVNGKDAEGMPQGGPNEPKIVRVGGILMQSKLVNKVHPVYPASAKAAGIQGTVLLDAVVLKDGTLGEITVLSSPSDDLSQASLEAVRQWRYEPTLLNGQPIEVITEVVINFTLMK